MPFDCFGYRLAMTIGISCHVERSETSLLVSHALCFPLVIIFIYDSILGFFLQGGQGDYLRAPPITSLNRKCFAFAIRLSLCAKRCFDPQPLHASQLIVLRTDYVMLHSASSMLR